MNYNYNYDDPSNQKKLNQPQQQPAQGTYG